MKEITSLEEYKELLQSGKTFIIKFGAPWCAPCKSIEPNLEQVASEGYEVYKINIDNIPEPAIELRVMGVPTTIGFVNSAIAKRQNGILNADQIKALLTVPVSGNTGGFGGYGISGNISF